MKKKIIALIMSLGLSISLVACNEKLINEYGNEVNKIGPYIEISSVEGWCNGRCYTFRTVYDKDTKIVYEMVTRSYGVTIYELHTYDDEGHPVLQFYEDGKIVTKQEIEEK